MAQVKEGDLVAIRYRALGVDGRILSATGDGAPLVLTAGSDDVLYGLSHGIIGMEIGEQAVLLIDAEDAFGEPKEAVERSIPKSRLPEDIDVGDGLWLTHGAARIFMWVVGEGAGDTWQLSTLHHFAGNIELHIEVVSP